MEYKDIKDFFLDIGKTINSIKEAYKQGKHEKEKISVFTDLKNGLKYRIEFYSDEDIIVDPDLIYLTAYCGKCELPLKESYGSAGLYGGTEDWLCPSCKFKINPDDKITLEAQLKSKIIKQLKRRSK
jgi:hypothetical protein